MNGQVEDWTAYAGYVVVLMASMEGDYCWNSVRKDWFGHGASCAWNGVRRETISQFVEDLRMVALGHDHPECQRSLYRARIRLVGEPVMASA